MNGTPGTLSWGTMREEDLIPCFTDELVRLGCQDSRLEKIKEKLRDDPEQYYGTEDSGWDLNEFLFEELNKYAPEGYYFGASEGDGADYGFWRYEE